MMDRMGHDENFEARLRSAVAKPLERWREIYESFSPVDLRTGERRPRVPEPGTDCRRAAVLVPIMLAPEGARVVYTLRTGELRDHAGQVSFPGGSPEPQDRSLLMTALREAEEEVDLEPDLVEVIGELEDMYIPPSKFLVRPFVGILWEGGWGSARGRGGGWEDGRRSRGGRRVTQRNPPRPPRTRSDQCSPPVRTR